MKHRGVIAAALAVSIFCLGCSATQTSTTETSEKKDLAVADVEQKVETVKAVTAVPTPDPNPMPTPEPTPEVPEEPEINFNARLYAYVVPEPEPEPEIVDSCFDENVETGEYHEDIPSGSGEYLGDWTITFYCPGSCCNGSYTGTASGAPLTPWHTCACGSLPFGTVVHIDGVGDFVVEDTGVSGAWIDVCVSSHDEALALGMRTASVYIVG